MSWHTHGKSIAMGAAAIVMAVLAAWREAADGGITASEVVLVVIAGFNVATVWGAANIPQWSKAKTFMAGVGVVLNTLVALVVGGLTGDEVMLLIIHFLGALGVAAAPAVSTTGTAYGTPPPGSRLHG